MYWEDKDGNNYELPSHCVNSPIGDYYYGDVGALHQVERVLNPLVRYRGMAGISALIGENFLWNLQNRKDIT
jgi:hypothetical protein